MTGYNWQNTVALWNINQKNCDTGTFYICNGGTLLFHWALKLALMKRACKVAQVIQFQLNILLSLK